MTEAAYEKKAFNSTVAHSFRGLVHLHHGREHSSTEADMELEQRVENVYLTHRLQVKGQ